MIVVAGASGCGKTHLIRRMGQPTHDDFVLKLLKQLDCDPDQRLKRSTVERMQRLLDPSNARKRKTRKLKHCLLIHLDLTSINHRSNLMLLRQIAANTQRLDVLTLYTPHWNGKNAFFSSFTENEPSMRAAVIALSGRISTKLTAVLYHREYRKWFTELNSFEVQHSYMANSFSETLLQ